MGDKIVWMMRRVPLSIDDLRMLEYACRREVTQHKNDAARNKNPSLRYHELKIGARPPRPVCSRSLSSRGSYVGAMPSGRARCATHPASRFRSIFVPACSDVTARSVASANARFATARSSIGSRPSRIAARAFAANSRASFSETSRKRSEAHRPHATAVSAPKHPACRAFRTDLKTQAADHANGPQSGTFG